MNIREKFTIFITLHERKHYLKRLLTYFADFPCRQIVVDSSIDSWEFAADFPHVEFFHLPGIDYFENLYQGIKQISTEFVLQIPDDDFTLKESITECLAFLMKHPDYMGAGGQSLLFNERSGDFLPERDGGEYIKKLTVDFHGNDALERLKFLFNRRFSFIHHVLRTDVWRTCLEIVRNYPRLYSINYFEIIFLYIGLVKGNYKFLPVLQLVRSTGLSVHRDKSITVPSIGKEIRFRDFPLNLSRSGDPLSAILADETHKNMVICRFWTNYLFINGFGMRRIYLRHTFSFGWLIAKLPKFILKPLKALKAKIKKRRVVETSLSGETVQTGLTADELIGVNSAESDGFVQPIHDARNRDELIYISQLVKNSGKG